jgi:dihydrodipicolinate synthase/N-acetylneuraminate lyase
MSTFMEKCASKVPTFAGIKFTSSDLQELAKCIQVCKKHESKNLRVFLGCDDVSIIIYIR